MEPYSAIQKFLASILLLLFIISVAPKSYFHDLVAHHKDVSSCNLNHQTTVLHKQEFNCQFVELVVSAPFVLNVEPGKVFRNLYFENILSSFTVTYFEPFLQHKENRGPPFA